MALKTSSLNFNGLRPKFKLDIVFFSRLSNLGFDIISSRNTCCKYIRSTQIFQIMGGENFGLLAQQKTVGWVFYSIRVI